MSETWYCIPKRKGLSNIGIFTGKGRMPQGIEMTLACDWIPSQD